MGEVQLGSSLQVVTTVAGQIVQSLAEQRVERREAGDSSDRAISYCQITQPYNSLPFPFPNQTMLNLVFLHNSNVQGHSVRTFSVRGL